MDSVPLEKQIAVLKGHRDCFVRSRGTNRFVRSAEDDVAALCAAEQTLSRLLALREHLQKADHDDEAAGEALAEELVAVLALPLPAA